MSQQTKYRQISEKHALPLFLQPWWLDMCGIKWDAAIVEDSKGVQAVWPYTVEHKAGITIIRNPVLTPYLGPYFLVPAAAKESKQLNLEDKIYTAFWEQLVKWNSFDVQCLPGYNNFLPFHHTGFTCSQRITYHINLEQTEEQIFSNMSDAKRQHIRNAEKELVIADDKKFMDQFYALHADTLVRKGKKLPYAKEHFEKLVQTSVEHNAGLFMTAVDDAGAVKAMLFTVYDSGKMYLLLSAINSASVHNGAATLLIWEAIKRARAMGLKVFDFEGSMDAGIEKFFRSFGGNRVPYLSCTANKSTVWKLKKALLG